MAVLFVLVTFLRVGTVILCVYTLARLTSMIRDTKRHWKVRASCETAQYAMLWMAVGTFFASSLGILLGAPPSPGAIFYPVLWVGLVKVVRWIDRWYADFGNEKR